MPDSALLPSFLAQIDDEPEGEEERIAAGDAYATVTGQRQAVALKYLRSQASSFAVPYAYLPLTWWHSSALLLIEYPGLFTVALHGRNLGELERRITDRRVTWVRECGETAARLLPVAVTRIDLLRSYPSREGDGMPAAP